MSAPIWMAAPPEVHSALLISGPGPGPLLAAATAWNSLSAEYAAVAQELSALLATVQAATWEGPTAEAYVSAHGPYLAWLVQASADSAAMAGRQETAATAYTAAVAAMPTLAELAANHVAHGALVATNFFGINTIPISLNEADYVRMWIQAATVMGSYQAASTAAVTCTPQTSPAPQIRKTNAPAAFSDKWLPPLPPDNQNWVMQFLQRIGYIDFYNNFLAPLINALANNPFLQAMFSGIDPYLLILGNPLTYLNPFNIAFALGYPMDLASYIAFLSETFTFIAADLAAAFASGNPLTIGLTILFVTVEAIGTIITDTIALLKTLLEQTAVLFMVVVPLLVAPLVPLAAGAVLTPIGVKGLAALAAGPPPALPSTPGIALAPSVPPSSPAPTPISASPTTPAPTSASTTPPTSASPPVTGTGGMGMGMGNFGYLVGGLNADAKRAAGTGARKKAVAPDNTEAPAVATSPLDQARSQRRRRAKAQQLGRGYEYMDLEADEMVASAASDHGAGTLGFAGTTIKSGPGPAAGLVTLPNDAFGEGPRAPMLPRTWDTEPA